MSSVRRLIIIDSHWLLAVTGKTEDKLLTKTVDYLELTSKGSQWIFKIETVSDIVAQEISFLI